MKGNINLGDKIYKLSSKSDLLVARESYKKENRKVLLNGKVTIQKGQPLSIVVKSASNLPLYKNLNINCQLDCLPIEAKNRPLDKETVSKQLSKTSSTPYQFKKIDIQLDDNLFLPKLSMLNELRRTSLENVEKYALEQMARKSQVNTKCRTKNNQKSNNKDTKKHAPKITLLLNLLNPELDYSKLDLVDDLYIPLKYFADRKYENTLKTLTQRFTTYIYLPTIKKINYRNLFYNNVEKAINQYKIRGFILSNIGNIQLLNNLSFDTDKTFKIVANYTFNVFNTNTIIELKKLGISRFTLSPELDKASMLNLCNTNYLQKELIVYGRIPLLNMNYCLLGKTDLCDPACKQLCKTNHSYYLKDRLNMKFKILPDNIQTVTTVFNSKTTCISPKQFPIDYARIDILDENISEINHIICAMGTFPFAHGMLNLLDVPKSPLIG